MTKQISPLHPDIRREDGTLPNLLVVSECTALVVIEPHIVKKLNDFLQPKYRTKFDSILNGPPLGDRPIFHVSF